MRKTLLFLLLLLSMGICAKPYDHSLGVSMGFFDGASYKVLVTDHFAVQTDVGFHLTIFDDVYGTFIVNPMFMYQGCMDSHAICDIDWFGGAGTSLGFATNRLGYSPYRWGGGPIGGEFGLNGILGIEVAFNRAPLALSFDFRPGYGLYYGDVIDYYSSYYSSSYYSYDYYDFGLQHYFDWGLNLGLRFYL